MKALDRALCQLCDRRPAAVELVLKRAHVISTCALCAAEVADDGVDLEPVSLRSDGGA